MQRYNLTTSQHQSAQSNFTGTKKSRESQRFINLSGNIKKNIQELANQLACYSSCEARQILHILADKIQKLRCERDSLKSKYVEDVHILHRKIKMLERENRDMAIKLEELTSLRTSQCRVGIEADYEPIRLIGEDLGLDKIRGPEQSTGEELDKAEQDYEEIKRIALKYNINGDELERMLEQYLVGGSQVVGKREERRLKHLQSILSKQRQQNQLRLSIETQMKDARKSTKRRR